MSIPRASIWPNVVFDTSSAKGMAEAEAWQNEMIHDWLDVIQFGEVCPSGYRAHRKHPPEVRAGGWLREMRNASVSSVEPREAPNSTQGPREANRDAQPASFQAAANYLSRAPQPGAIGLLEAALAEARGAATEGHA